MNVVVSRSSLVVSEARYDHKGAECAETRLPMGEERVIANVSVVAQISMAAKPMSSCSNDEVVKRF